MENVEERKKRDWIGYINHLFSAPTDGYGSGRGFGDGYNGYGGGPGGQFLTYFGLWDLKSSFTLFVQFNVYIYKVFLNGLHSYLL